jgi:hypothetical protein
MRRIETSCKACGRTRETTRLEKCIICLAHFCRVCGFKRHGKAFCSRQCAEVFFFGDPDEQQ